MWVSGNDGKNQIFLFSDKMKTLNFWSNMVVSLLCLNLSVKICLKIIMAASQKRFVGLSSARFLEVIFFSGQLRQIFQRKLLTDCAVTFESASWDSVGSLANPLLPGDCDQEW
jgi:hypothetical protein